MIGQVIIVGNTGTNTDKEITMTTTATLAGVVVEVAAATRIKEVTTMMIVMVDTLDTVDIIVVVVPQFPTKVNMKATDTIHTGRTKLFFILVFGSVHLFFFFFSSFFHVRLL